MTDKMFEKGLEIRKAVLGADYVERSLEDADDFMMAFQKQVTTYCWGDGWGGEALSRRDRSLLNIGMLGSLGKTE